jgi:hypothetical protein
MLSPGVAGYFFPDRASPRRRTRECWMPSEVKLPTHCPGKVSDIPVDAGVANHIAVTHRCETPRQCC